MKKFLLLTSAAILLPFMATSVFAQTFQVSTQTFDLDKIDRAKGWEIYSGHLNPDGGLTVKVGQPSCNVDVSNRTGTLGTLSYKFYGLGYEFDELKFDKALNYVGKTTKTFPTTIATLAYEPVYGKKFMPDMGGYIKRKLTPEYVGRTVISLSIGLSGFSVASYYLGGRPVGSVSNWSGVKCGEVLAMEKGDKVSVKESKGEKWMPMDFAVYPGGGVILYSTFGVIKDRPDEHHFILKRYEETNETADRLVLSFSYKSYPSITPVIKADGSRDYIVINQGYNRYHGKATEAANYAELIYIDGKTFTVKNREKMTLTYSKWCVEDAVVDADGTIYLYGTAGANNKDYFGLLGAPTTRAGGGVGLQHGGGTAPKDYPNFQLLSCTKDGKLNYLTAVDAKAAESVAQVIQGVKGAKAKSTVIFNTQAYDKDIFFTKDLLIMAGQQLLNPVQSDKDNLFVACFEKATGKLKNYYIKPETYFATQNLIFNKDRSTLYWAAYDLQSLNVNNSESGESKFMAPKKVKSMLAGYLYLSKIDLTSGKASNFELIGENQFALSYKAPVLVGDDNADEIIFQGRTMDKKAKDSNLIFVRVKK